MAEPMPDCPIAEGKEAGRAELTMWNHALWLLISDARRYWQGKTDALEAEQAFDDVCRNGPMIRRLCCFTGHDSEWLSQGFLRWCENMA